MRYSTLPEASSTPCRSTRVGITGFRSSIIQELLGFLPDTEAVTAAPAANLPDDCGRYIFCAGYLAGAAAADMSDADAHKTFDVNVVDVIRACDRILAANDEARICVIGSESGFSGSYDSLYAAAKAALHHYVQTKALRTPDQQLVCIAPWIIEDSGMTARRTDIANLEMKKAQHPKRRFLSAVEVARLVHHVLYVDEGFLSGIVIRMNGGAHTGRR